MAYDGVLTLPKPSSNDVRRPSQPWLVNKQLKRFPARLPLKPSHPSNFLNCSVDWPIAIPAYGASLLYWSAIGVQSQVCNEVHSFDRFARDIGDAVVETA
jgi:hypothetical protein